VLVCGVGIPFEFARWRISSTIFSAIFDRLPTRRALLSSRRYKRSDPDNETVAARRQRALLLQNAEVAPGFIPPDAFALSGMCLLTFVTEILQAPIPNIIGRNEMTRLWNASGWTEHLPSVLVSAPLLPEKPILEYFKKEVEVAKDPHDAAVIKRGIQHIQGRANVNSLSLLIANEEVGLSDSLIAARMLLEPSWSPETQRCGVGPCVATHRVIATLSLAPRPEQPQEGGPRYSVKSIHAAACSCYHGVGGKCAHVSALLYALHGLPLPGMGGKSCTSMRCRWAQRIVDGEVLDESTFCTLRMLAIDKARSDGARKLVAPSATPFYRVLSKRMRDSLLEAVNRVKVARVDKAVHLRELNKAFPMLQELHHSRAHGSARIEAETHVMKSLVVEEGANLEAAGDS
jgi:hypothetical protein